MGASRRIAILLPDLRRGGTEQVRLLLAREFARRGYQVEFVLARRIGELLDELPAGVEAVDLNAPRFRQALWPLVGYLRSRRPDVLLAAPWPLTGLAVAATRIAGTGCRCVVSEHSHLSRSPVMRGLGGLVHRRLGRLIYGAAAAVAVVSEGVRQDLVARTGIAPAKVRVIYNPVRTPRPGPVMQPAIADWWKKGGARIISVGSLKPAKDYATLLRALARLRETCDARLLILGEGSSRAELEAEVRRLQLDEVVLMPGAVADPYPYLAQAQLFVLSSAWEGLPNVLTEALAVGTPVVSTDCLSGPREILDNGRFGRLTPVGDPDALAHAMRQTLAEPPDPGKLKARAADFSEGRAADHYLALLDPEASA